MSERFITNEEARALLKARCRVYGSIRALATQTGTAPCSISSMISGDRLVSRAIGDALGLRAVRGFVRTESAR